MWHNSFEPQTCRERRWVSTHSSTHCNTLQHTVTHCNTLQHTATHCNTLQRTLRKVPSPHTFANTMQHTATHCNTLQHTASHCITLQHTATHCNTLQHTATHCNTRQHTATHLKLVEKGAESPHVRVLLHTTISPWSVRNNVCARKSKRHVLQRHVLRQLI